MPDGTNFSVFSRNAGQVEVLLYEATDSPEPLQVVSLDPEVNRSYFFRVDTFDNKDFGILPLEIQHAVLPRSRRAQPRPVTIFESRH